MELRHIRYFVRAAELLHFTQAAESLYISQPTLSTHIHQLEEEVGLTLFDRIGRHVALTEAGKMFLEHAERALHELDMAVERIADLKGLVSGRLRLSSLSVFGNELMPSWITTFHAVYPQIVMDLKTGNSDTIEEDLQSGRIDLALSYVPSTNELFASETLFTEQVFLVVAKQHPLATKSEIELQDLNNIPLALGSRRLAGRRMIDSFFFENRILANVLLETDDLPALLKILSAGDVGSLLARITVGKHPDLCLVPIAGKQLYVSYGVLWNKQCHLSPSAQAFLEHIKQK
jgi:LysR family transcriptional regulator, cyn operon transcriptional activator